MAETILQQPTIASTSIDSPNDLLQVWALVDDNVVSPSKTRKLSLAALLQLDRHYLKPTGVIGDVDNVPLTGNEPYTVLVDSIDEKDNIVVPDGMTCVVVNVSEALEPVDVSTTGNPQFTLQPAMWAWVTWSPTAVGGPKHVVTIPAGSLVDAGMSDVSANPVRNSTIKAYVDAVHQRTLTVASHGLTAADEEKPLTWNGTSYTVYDDTSATQYPLFFLDKVVDVNNIRVIWSGVVTFDSTRLEVGYSLSGDGPYIFWDKSDDQYESVKPGDSAPRARELFAVLGISGGVVTALKLLWGP